MVITKFLTLIFGLLLLVKGADLLLSSSIAIGKRFKVSDFFIGLVIVGFGTSLPELLVSIDSIIKESPGLSIGNVLGSNISNILLVLGVVLAFYEITFQKISKFDVFFHLSCHLVLFIVVLFSSFNSVVGLFFIFLFLFYLWNSYQNSSNQTENNEEAKDKLSKIIVRNPIKLGIPIILISVFLTFFGASITVNSALDIAYILGISDAFLGLTVVAIGTSLPEIITSVKAAQKSKSQLVLGNIIGSNIYNLLLILGSVSLFDVFTFSASLNFEVKFLVFSVLVFSIIMYFNIQLKKQFSIIFLFAYLIYLFRLYSVNF
jgi:cation:H+ antiporter